MFLLSLGRTSESSFDQHLCRKKCKQSGTGRCCEEENLTIESVLSHVLSLVYKYHPALQAS